MAVLNFAISREDIASVVELIKDLMVRPSSVFEKDKIIRSTNYVLLIFAATILIQFLKSFSFKRNWINFFANEGLNTFFGALSIPQVKLIIFYLYYGLFLLGVIFVSKKLCRAVSVRALVLSILSISGIGLLLHCITAALDFIINIKVLWFIRLPALLWVAVLTVKAISVSQEVSIRKAFVCFFIPFFLVAVILAVILPYIISPYFLFLV